MAFGSYKVACFTYSLSLNILQIPGFYQSLLPGTVNTHEAGAADVQTSQRKSVSYLS